MVTFVQWLVTGLTVVILADVLVSYVLDPLHPVRSALDRVVRPMLAPIRRVLPAAGMLDFSPFVLLIAVQLIGALLIRILSSG